MKRVLILFVLSFVFFKGYSQIYQKPLLFGKEENRLHVWNSLAIPNDTVILAAKKPYPAVAVKDGVLYTWNVLLQKWNPATGDTTNNNYPTTLGFNTANGVVTLGRNGLSSLTVDLDGRWALNSDVVHYSDSVTYYATQHDLDSISRTLTTIVNNIDSTQDNTTYTGGLEKVGNDVHALYSNAIWNANKIQGLYVSAVPPGNGYFLGFDSANGIWRAMKPDSVVGAIGAITQSQLDDTAASIRADFPAGGSGGSQDLQTTLVNGNNAHMNINLKAGGNNTAFNVTDTTYGTTAYMSADNQSGYLALFNAAGQDVYLHSNLISTTRFLELPDASDTLADRTWVRSLLGGSGGSSTDPEAWHNSGTTTFTGNVTIERNAGETFTMNGTNSITFNSLGSQLFVSGNESYLQAYDPDQGDGAGLKVYYGSGVTDAGKASIYADASDRGQDIWVEHNKTTLHRWGAQTNYILIINSLPVYADESAATSGGLATGTVYKTSTGELRIKL